MTLIEVAIAASVLVVGLLGFMRVIIMSLDSTAANWEADVATQAAREAIEELQAADFATLQATYGMPPGGGVPGNAFDVEGLDPDPADPDGRVGEIVLPILAAGGAIQVREDLQLPELGMPRDLNGDGQQDALDHSADKQILPVLVRLRWRGATGIARLEFRTLIAPY
jgi:hypothetical protein